MVGAVAFTPMKNSHIEWTDHTFNPWEGCTKVSPGCAHCYAEARNLRFSGGENWGPGAPRRRTSAAYWKQPLKWNGEAAEFLLKNPMAPRPRVFCASLADWLDDEVPIEWLIDLLDLIRSTPNLDWLLLTKRPENFRERVGNWGPAKASMALQGWVYDWFHGNPPANVWIGTTVEDQQRADERIPDLLKIPARVRFLSCEPLLGPVNLDLHERFLRYAAIVDWVICGGESGKGARPMHPDWARSLRDQCAAACVSFFFKQWGEWVPDHRYTAKGEHSLVSSGRHWTAAEMTKTGKLTAGRMLDGKEHSAFPHPATCHPSPVL